jgi:dipeptidyl aminopeptidase/acylaminoacyl peptidase
MPAFLRFCIASMVCLAASSAHAALPTQATAAPQTAHKLIPVEMFVRQDDFNEIKLSPTGEYVARTGPLDEKVVLVISRRSDGKVTGHFNLGGKTQVLDFWWVNDKRLLISVGEKFGELERPQATGELYATNADGTGQDLLVGWRATPENHGSHITTGKKEELVAASLIDTLPNDPDHVLVAVSDLGDDAPYTRVEEMDVNSGHRRVIAHAPVRRASFVTDANGIVRFATGAGVDNLFKTYYRDGPSAEWQLINDESVTQRIMTPLGFAADGQTAYVEDEEQQGPDSIYVFDAATRKLQLKLRDATVDPGQILHSPNGEVPIGVRYMDGKPKIVLFDDTSSLSKLYRSLEASFPGQSVILYSFTHDGKQALLSVSSDRSPGDIYVFNLDSKKAEHLITSRDWIDPDRMGEVRPVTLTARDGLVLHGYLTLPNGSAGKNLPLVVNPHGGPFGISDVWGFNWEVQLLASRGYAVLQVNYRGSSNYGRAFLHAGYKQWGGKMQDDLTDATRWAIKEGIADPKRICIYGASYGGYAALMGVAKEPSLYRCAIGYVGVYDMNAMYHTGDIQDSKSGENFLKDTLGDENLDAISPDHLADRITVPVMLVAGREDVRAPPKHTELLRDALQHAGKQVDAKIYDKEGHGFFIQADKLDFYTRMLAFLDRNIGDHGGGATAAAPAQADSKH